MFIVFTKYIKPMPEVEKFLVEHRAYLAKYYAEGKLLASGPQQPRTGGVIIANNMTREEVEDFMKHDPFTREGVSEYSITEFLPVKYAPELEALVNPA